MENLYTERRTVRPYVRYILQEKSIPRGLKMDKDNQYKLTVIKTTQSEMSPEKPCLK